MLGIPVFYNKAAGVKKNKKKKHNRKFKLNTKEVIISTALIDSCISHDILTWIKNMLKREEEIKSLKTSSFDQSF